MLNGIARRVRCCAARVLLVLALLCALTAAGRPSSAQAPNPPAPRPPSAAVEHHCAAASALEGLTEAKRKQVQALCERENKLDHEAAQVLSALLDELAGSPRWQTTLLLSLTAHNLLAAPSIPNLAALLQKPPKACTLKAALDADVSNRSLNHPVGTPLTIESLKLCLSDLSPLAGLDSGQTRVLTIVGGAGDRVSLAVFGPKSTVQALSMESYIDHGFRYFVALLPASARVLVLHQPANPVETALVYEFVSATDMVNLPVELDRRYCVEVQVKASSDTLVLLDAQLLARVQYSPSAVQAAAAPGAEHSYWVRAQVELGDHYLNVLRADNGGELARLVIPQRELSPRQCATHRLDLSERKDIAFTIAVDPACAKAGVVAARARVFMKQQLEEFHREGVKDLEAWAEVFRTVHGLQQNIGVFGAQSDGPARGSLDSFESLRLAAAELTREGFSSAYVSQLSCGSDGGAEASPVASAQSSPTFIVYELNVAKLRAAAKGEHSDLSKAISAEYETVTSVDDLRDLIAAPLARLHGRGYVRWVTDGAEQRLYGSPRALLELQAPQAGSASVSTRLYALPAGQARAYCSTLQRRRRLVSLDSLQPPEASPSAKELSSYQLEGGTGASETSVELPGLRHKGVYVVEASWVSTPPPARAEQANKDVESEPTSGQSFACVTVTDSRTHVWALMDAAFFSFGSRNESDSITALAGLTFSPTGDTGLMAVAGGSVTFLSTSAPPSWDDSATFHDYDVNGRAELTWQRQSFLLGAGLQYDLAYWRGGALVLRSALLMDIGQIEAGTIPSGLSTFLEKRSADDSIIDVDLTAVAQAGFRVQLGERLHMFGFAGFWARGFDDGIFDRQTSIRHDGGFNISAALGLGYDL